jgi:peroxiredoxin
MRLQPLLCVALLTWSVPALAAEVGKTAPAFTLKDQRGAQHSLQQYRGKVVVLEWINPECPYVKRHHEVDTMDKTLASFPQDKVVWLAIDSTAHNTPEKSAAWHGEQKLPYPILQDPEGTVGRSYQAKTTPQMYVIDAEGVLRYVGAIDDDPRGKNPKPVNHVKQAVDAVLEGKSPPAATTTPYGCTVKYKG